MHRKFSTHCNQKPRVIILRSLPSYFLFSRNVLFSIQQENHKNVKLVVGVNGTRAIIKHLRSNTIRDYLKKIVWWPEKTSRLSEK